MTKYCPRCNQRLLNGQLVELTVIAPYRQLPSNVAFSIGTPIDSYPESLVHHDCQEGGLDDSASIY